MHRLIWIIFVLLFLLPQYLAAQQEKAKEKNDGVIKKTLDVEKNLRFYQELRNKTDIIELQKPILLDDQWMHLPENQYKLQQAELTQATFSMQAMSIVIDPKFEQKKNRLFGPSVFDSRIELRQLNPLINWQYDMLKNAAAIGLLVKKDALKKLNDSLFQLSTQTLKEKFKLCADEAFADQPVGGIATVFLVSSTSVLTAAHALDEQVENYAIVFGFELLNKQGTLNELIPASNIYNLTNVLARDDESDMLLLSLDKPTIRNPLKFSKSETKIGDEVYMIGHPAGLPMKVALNAAVLKNQPHYYYTSLDAFQGNSGAPVFDKASHQVIGILVSGMTDYRWRGNCFVSNLCQYPYCDGEKVLKATLIIKLLDSKIQE